MTGKKLKVLSRVPVLGPKARNREPSADDVRELWRVTCAKYRTTAVVEWTAEDIAKVRKVLASMGIVPSPDFMEKFVVTIGDGIYVPFRPGIAGVRWTLRQQVDVVAHEHEHVVRDRAPPGIEYEFGYATNATTRAYDEMQAYRADMVVEWRLWRTALDPQSIASMLKDYGCGADDVAMVAKMLRLSMISIRKGAMPSEPARFVCDFLEARWS